MSNEESFTGLKEFLQPMVVRYACDKKVAPHVDAASGALSAGDRETADHALRELYKSGRRLRDEDRERVLMCLKLLNTRDLPPRERSGDSGRVAQRRRSRPWIVGPLLTLGGIAMLAVGWQIGQGRLMMLGSIALGLGMFELGSNLYSR